MNKEGNSSKAGKRTEEMNRKKSTIIYHEALDCDLHLVVYKDYAYVEYDFSKYAKDGTHEYLIPVDEIDEHLKALKENLELYLKTKDTVGKTAVSFPGQRNMQICLNSRSSGVCIDRYYFPVASEDDYLKYERDFNYCKDKSREVIESYAKCGADKLQ